ncbi:MAG: diacylglycerol/lipid kinase family protein [Acidobacteriaceae bacterium]
MRRVFVFYNPILVASRGRRALFERIEAMMRNGHEAEGREVRVAPTFSATSAGAQAAEAVEAGYDTVLVCGGDGTVFQVLQGIAGKGVSLGVVPLGTGNVIAQNLGLPRNPLHAAQMLLHGQPRQVRLGKLKVAPVGHARPKSWFFLIAAGMGLHASLMNLSQMGNGKRLGGRAAYFAGGARLLLKEPIEEFLLDITRASGETLTVEAAEAIAVALPAINVWQPGGSWFVDSLRLAWIPRCGRMKFFRSVLAALTNRVPAPGKGKTGQMRPYYEDIVRMVCRPLPDGKRQPRLLVEADGEVLGTRQLEVSVAEERISLVFPPQ